MSRKADRVPFSAVWMPVIRDRHLRLWEDTARLMERNGGIDPGFLSHGVPWREVRDEALTQVQALRDADLYFVRSDMVSLAVHAAVDDGELPFVEPPSDCGYMLFEGGLCPTTDETREVVRMYGLLWWIGDDDHIHYDTLADVMFDRMHVRVRKRAGMDDARDARDLGAGWHDPDSFLSRVLRALWALMAEPSVAEVAQGASAARLERVPARVSEQARRVRVIDVREHNEPERVDGDGSRRYKPYDHRFIVSGHWREQACGPNHSERRRRWIAPYVKGPKDKPLVLKDTVRVWRA